MDTPHRSTARAPLDAFAWQYAFYAHLIHRHATLTSAEMSDLAQALYAIQGHLQPVAVANEVLRTWPFDVTD